MRKRLVASCLAVAAAFALGGCVYDDYYDRGHDHRHHYGGRGGDWRRDDWRHRRTTYYDRHHRYYHRDPYWHRW
jgi:hypothetical protein